MRRGAGPSAAVVGLALGLAACTGPDPVMADLVLPGTVLGLDAGGTTSDQALAEIGQVLDGRTSTTSRTYVASSGLPVYFVYLAVGRVDDSARTEQSFLDGFAARPGERAGEPVALPHGGGPGSCAVGSSGGQDVVVCVSAADDRVLAAVDFRPVPTDVAAADFAEVRRTLGR